MITEEPRAAEHAVDLGDNALADGRGKKLAVQGGHPRVSAIFTATAFHDGAGRFDAGGQVDDPVPDGLLAGEPALVHMIEKDFESRLRDSDTDRAERGSGLADRADYPRSLSFRTEQRFRADPAGLQLDKPGCAGPHPDQVENISGNQAGVFGLDQEKTLPGRAVGQ